MAVRRRKVFGGRRFAGASGTGDAYGQIVGLYDKLVEKLPPSR